MESCLTVLMLATAAPGPLPAQARADGSPGAAAAGGALGLLSGAVLGVAGSIIPCTQTWDGARCITGHAIGGGALGLLGGALAGAGDRDLVRSAALSAGIGFLAGGAAGLVLKPVAQRFGWPDVFTVGLLGGAIGASPGGAAIGFGGGAVAGLIIWRVLPGRSFPDALAAVLAGTALGGLGGWLLRGMNAQPGDAISVRVPVAHIRF
jgi:hypothetical protein